MENQVIDEALKAQIEEITSKIDAQMHETEVDNYFIYAFIGIIAISMIFEYFVRLYKNQIREKKETGELPGKERKKLLIIFGIHFLVTTIFLLICTFILKLPSVLNIVFVTITVCIVWIGTVKIKFRRKKEK